MLARRHDVQHSDQDRTYPLGVDHFGQSADVVDLYREHGLDEEAIVTAIARACLDRLERR